MASATWDANFSLNPTLNYKQTTNELFKRFTSKIVLKRWKGWSQLVCRGYRWTGAIPQSKCQIRLQQLPLQRQPVPRLGHQGGGRSLSPVRQLAAPEPRPQRPLEASDALQQLPLVRRHAVIQKPAAKHHRLWHIFTNGGFSNDCNIYIPNFAEIPSFASFWKNSCKIWHADAVEPEKWQTRQAASATAPHLLSTTSLVCTVQQQELNQELRERYRKACTKYANRVFNLE